MLANTADIEASWPATIKKLNKPEQALGSSKTLGPNSRITKNRDICGSWTWTTNVQSGVEAGDGTLPVPSLSDVAVRNRTHRNMWSFDVVFIILVVALPVVVVGQSTTFCNISRVEYNALEALYNSCNGDNWSWDLLHPEQKWIFPSTLDKPCLYGWQGLKCYSVGNFSCSIGEIDLSNTNLMGTLPDAIGNFTDLSSLNLDFNPIYGSLPDAIGNWQALQAIEIVLTSLSGSLPTSLYTLTSLKSMILYQNQYTGK
jgi:hypothetical protein